MRLRRGQGAPEPRGVPVHRTALWRGALLEIGRLDAKASRLEAENARLRAKLACYEAHEDRYFVRDHDTAVMP